MGSIPKSNSGDMAHESVVRVLAQYRVELSEAKILPRRIIMAWKSFILALISGGILGTLGLDYVGAYCIGMLVTMLQNEERFNETIRAFKRP